MNILPLFDPTLDDNVEMSNAIPPTPGPASKRALSAVSSIEENPHDKLVPVYIEPKVLFFRIEPSRYLLLALQLHAGIRWIAKNLLQLSLELT